MRNDQLLLQRLRDAFRHDHWCKSLFERAEQNQSALASRKILKATS